MNDLQLFESWVRIPGLEASERDVIAKHLRRLSRTRRRNERQQVYADGHMALTNFGIAIPPELTKIAVVLDWPKRAVDELVDLHEFQGFTLDAREDPYGVDELLDVNQFDLVLSQAQTAAYTMGPSFLSVTRGDPDKGEADVVVTASDALDTTGQWDGRIHGLSSALTVTKRVSEPLDPRTVPVGGFPFGDPTILAFVFFTPEFILEFSRPEKSAAWTLVRYRNSLGRVPIEVLRSAPTLRNPFGISRISRPVRYFTDAAIRTLLRMEVGAEFFIAPQRYLVGLDERQMDELDKWSAVMGRILAFTLNEDGDKIDVGQFPQMSTEPLISQYRMFAQNFCAATRLPMSSVGIHAENPASAEAMQVAEAGLARIAERQWRVFSPSLRRTLENVVRTADPSAGPIEDLHKVRVTWTPARYVSPQAASDYALKLVSAFPHLAKTRLALRKAGLTEDEINEVMAELNDANASEVLDRLLAATPAQLQSPEEEAAEEAADGERQGRSEASKERARAAAQIQQASE